LNLLSNAGNEIRMRHFLQKKDCNDGRGGIVTEFSLRTILFAASSIASRTSRKQYVTLVAIKGDPS